MPAHVVLKVFAGVLLAGAPAASEALVPQQQQTCGLEKVEGRIFGSSHFAEPQVDSADQCCAACAAAGAKCLAYTFEDSTKQCFLKDNNADGGAAAGRTSGRNPPPGCSLEPGIEYIGNDVQEPSTVTDEAACCSACTGSSECLFFTYEGGTNGLCHLKNTNAPDNQRANASCTSGYVGSTPPAPPAPRDVAIVIAQGLRWTTSNHFVCYNIDASANRGFFWRNLSAASPDLYGAQLARQAAAIGAVQPAGYSLLRFGGSGNDYLTYEFGNTKCPDPLTDTKQCLNQSTWQDLLSFTEAASARLIFGLSMNTGTDFKKGTGKKSGPFPYPWDPSNAREILQWTIDAQLDHLIAAFELGNEQNEKYTAEMTATDFLVLYNLTKELWPNQSNRYGTCHDVLPCLWPLPKLRTKGSICCFGLWPARLSHRCAAAVIDVVVVGGGVVVMLPCALRRLPPCRPVLFGPDPHSLHDATGSQLDWIAGWLDDCAKNQVPVAGVTHHEYIEVDPSVDGFTSASTLAKNSQIAAAINATVRVHATDTNATGIFGGEIGPHNGGSPVCDHTSMRWAVFGDALWYADALASKAFHGYAGFCRQDYIGADYGLVDCSTGTPLPDFYTALLFATTMGPNVLQVTATLGPTPGSGAPLPAENSTVRLYAHCSNNAGLKIGTVWPTLLNTDATGSVTLLAINLGNQSSTLHLGNDNGTQTIVSAAAQTVQAFVLEGTAAPGSSLSNGTGLLGTGVTLNGKLLHLGPHGQLPALVPQTMSGPSVELPAWSVSFLVLPDAGHPSCSA